MRPKSRDFSQFPVCTIVECFSTMTKALCVFGVLMLDPVGLECITSKASRGLTSRMHGEEE